ncbi:ABC transporter permease subunit [Candidatus Fermentibacteria bacterium]|nr:ABC transporter permease subunit [Candidatus Fermentibacteria bacterium]
MMLASVLAKTLRDNWRGWVIAIASLSAMLLLSMWAYREIDLSFYTSLPEIYRSMLGIPENAEVASLAINAHMGSYGSMTFAAIALGMGAASIAGEERAGTIALLLANPRSRTHLLVSKAASIVLLAGLGVLACWGTIHLSAQALGISIAGLQLGALTFHLVVSTLFYGFLAMAVGAWTGNQGAAAGVAAGVMLLSFVAVGVLPLVEGAGDYVKAFPWYYFNGADPLLNGVSWGHIGVLSGGCIAFATVALIGVNRRDLKAQSIGITIIDRLRTNPLIGKVIGRLAGSARVSSIWAKTAAEYQWLLLLVAVYTFFVQGVMLGPMYAAIPEDLLTTFSGFPEVMLALFGGGDISTPQGFYQIETFGMMAPIVVMVVTICHRGRCACRRRVSPDHGPAARQSNQALQGHPREDPDHDTLCRSGGFRDIRRGRPGFGARRPGHTHGTHRSRVPAADTRRAGLRRPGAGFGRGHRTQGRGRFRSGGGGPRSACSQWSGGTE